MEIEFNYLRSWRGDEGKLHAEGMAFGGEIASGNRQVAHFKWDRSVERYRLSHIEGRWGKTPARKLAPKMVRALEEQAA